METCSSEIQMKPHFCCSVLYCTNSSAGQVQLGLCPLVRTAMMGSSCPHWQAIDCPHDELAPDSPLCGEPEKLEPLKSKIA